MGRRLNHSTPTVINTELVPFDESFLVEADGQTEQWYYDNTALYSPNRKITPLTLTPRLSVYDQDTKQTYSTDVTSMSDPQHLAFYIVQWYAMEYDVTEGDYVETLITNSTDSASADYVMSGNTLIVKKNVSFSHSVTIRCVATYQDPRDAGITYTVQDTVLLTCNRDANVIYPECAIVSPSARSFNPLLDYDGQGNQLSQFTFDAALTNSPNRADMPTGAKYKADGWGTEEILPSNDDGLVSCAPTVDIRYGDGSLDTGAEFVFRPTGNGEHLDVGSGYRTITWNQKFTNPYITEGYGCYCTDNQNGSYSVRTASTGSTSSPDVVSLNISALSGHKIYTKSPVESSANTVFIKLWAGALSVYGGNSVIYTVGSTDYFYIRFASGAIVTTPVVFWPMIIDLTELYGDGNEPATAAAFEADYERWFGHPLTYEPYNGGETMRVYDGEGFKTDYGIITSIKGKTVMWNQLVQNGNFAQGTTGWSAYLGTGTISVANNELTYTIGTVENTKYGNTTNKSVDVIEGHKYYLSYNIYVTKHSAVNLGYFIDFGTEIEVDAGWHRLPVIEIATTTTTTVHRHGISKAEDYGYSIGDYYKIKNSVVIDLTLMYGAGNEPATAAAFEADFERWFGHPLTYEDYEAGKLIPVNMVGIKTTGFNQCIEQPINLVSASFPAFDKSKYTKVLGGMSYHIRHSKLNTTNWRVCIKAYDVGGNAIKENLYIVSGGTYSGYYSSANVWVDPVNNDRTEFFITFTNTCYVYFGFGLGTVSAGTEMPTDLTVHLAHDNSRNGEYEPHWDMTRELDVTKFYGKINGTGEYIQCFPDGMKTADYAGTVYDSVDLVGATAVRRAKVVNMGTLHWTSDTQLGEPIFKATISDGNGAESGWLMSNILSSKYTAETQASYYVDNKAISGVALPTGGMQIRVHDTEYASSTAEQFATAMDGVYLYYELATPIHFTDLVYSENGQDIPVQKLNRSNFVWYCMDNGVETKADKLPCYVSGQGTSTLVMDAMWKEDMNVVLRCTMDVANDVLSPSKAYASVSWRIPDVDTHVVSQNGGAVRSDTSSMTFGTICNAGSTTISDTVKTAHMRFNWKYRKSNSSTENDAGWGNTTTITGANLKNVRGNNNSLASTLVYPYVYVLGAWVQQTSQVVPAYGQPTTTKDGITYVRKID